MSKTAFLIPILLATSGCGNMHFITKIAGHSVIGSGKLETETRTVSAFSEIRNEAAADIEVTIGPNQQVELTADNNVLPLVELTIEAKTEGSTLIIRSKGSITTSHPPKLRITVPSLDGISLKGSGDFKCADLKGKSFAASIQGSGDIELGGNVESATYSISGSGDISAFDLHAKSVAASISGSGSIKLTATDALKAETNGSGDIEYKGSPSKVDKAKNGSGDISPAG